MSKLDDYINFCSESLNKISVEKIEINKTFYFDESNNIKKGIIGQDKDNNGDLENLYFVLGGIAVNGSIDFDDLLNYVGARQVPIDSKFSFFAFKKILDFSQFGFFRSVGKNSCFTVCSLDSAQKNIPYSAEIFFVGIIFVDAFYIAFECCKVEHIL